MNEEKVKAFATRILQECEKEGLTVAEAMALPQQLKFEIEKASIKAKERIRFKICITDPCGTMVAAFHSTIRGTAEEVQET